MEHFERVVTAALLHDIGKVRFRIRRTRDKTHQNLGAEWIRKETYLDEDERKEIADIIQNHHKNPKELYPDAAIVVQADRYAAGEREEEVEEEGKWEIGTPLTPIFFYVGGKECVYPLLPLEKDKIPEAKTGRITLTEDDYERIWKGLNREINEIKNPLLRAGPDFILPALEKYLTFVPSFTYVKETPTAISLFDHLKLTGALAGSMYRYFEDEEGRISRTGVDEIVDREKEIFLLVRGDISGVQQFIYTITSKKALVNLRGRSFFLELLSHHVAERLIEELRLTRANILFVGGGGFEIIAYNTPEAVEKVEDYMKKVNEWLYEKFGVSLYMAWGCVPLPGKALGERELLEEKVKELHEMIERRKIRREYAPKVFEPVEIRGDECEICRRRNGREREEVTACDVCWRFINTGKTLKGGGETMIMRMPEGEEGDIEVVDGAYRVIKEEKKDIKFKAEQDPKILRHVYKINTFEPSPYLYAMSPSEKGSFEDISENGKFSLGTLRMDVDNLGRAFRKMESLTFYSSLSRFLNLFFKYWLIPLCEKDVIVVYSGGDDLFMVGRWEDVVKSAERIKDAFELFTGGNMGLSGGVFISDDHFPLYRMAENAGEAEHMAKNVDGKDAFCFNLTEGVKWEEWKKLREVVDILEGLRKDLGNTFIYNIYTILRKWHERKKKGETPWRLLPYLAYVVGRRETRKLQEKEEWRKLKNRLVPSFDEIYKLDHLYIPFMYMLLKTRETKEER